MLAKYIGRDICGAGFGASAPIRPRRTAVQTAVHVITTGVLIALLVGIATKLRWFGPNP